MGVRPCPGARRVRYNGGMSGSWRLGRLFGIPIEINASWLLVFALLVFLLARQFDDPRLRWPELLRWGVAVSTAAAFFASVLAHELSHSLVARYKGIPVEGITLFIFGGVSRLGREPRGPSAEFQVAVVGPVCSLALAAGLGAAWYALGRGDSPLELGLLLLAWGNLGLGLFNLLPGYPLDGGRVLRAGVWRLTGSYHRATQLAARCGQAVGLLMLLGGVPLALFGSVFNGVWLSLVGGFLLSAATSGYPRRRERWTAAAPVSPAERDSPFPGYGRQED